jgi:hypothetical protein
MISCSSVDQKVEKKINYEIKTKAYEVKWDVPSTPYNGVNVEIEGRLEGEKNKIVEMGDEFLEELNEMSEESSLLPFTLDGKYEVIENDQEIYSFIYKIYEYTGGAHGREEYIIYNISKKTGMPVNLEEVLGAGYEDKIVKKINNEISKNNKLKEGDPKKLYYSVDRITNLEKSDYYFEGKNIIIIFLEYEVAPYSSGKIKFEIPTTEL